MQTVHYRALIWVAQNVGSFVDLAKTSGFILEHVWQQWVYVYVLYGPYWIVEGNSTNMLKLAINKRHTCTW